MLTDISGSNLKPLDGFYNELRRKYPNTFTLATDLGKGDRVIQRLPRLDNEVHQTPVGVTPNAPNPVPPQIWTPDSFLYKVQSQKSRYGQRKEAETSHPGSGSLIIQDKTVSLPTLNRREYLGAQSRGSFRLPSLRTQVEQNQAELKSKLNTTRCEDVPKTDQNSSSRLKVNAKTEEPTSSTKTISKKGNLGGQPRPSAVKSDPMGTIMKELLPNKPGRIINDLSKSSKSANYNNGSLSDSDSGMSRCAPLKIFRPKSRSPHGAPTPGDIIKKFSAKPTMAHGPVRANHGVIPVTRIEVRNNSENFEMGESRKRDPINGNEKPQQKSPVARVRFEDESEHEAESRYKERSLQERNETSRNVVKGVASVPTQFQESVTKAVSSQVPPQSERYETQPITGQQGVTVPYRRQPFPPAVAKKVLIDIPTSGHHFKRPLHCEMSSVGTSRMDKPFSLRPRNETASLEGIDVSFGQWKGQENMVSRKTKEDYRLNQSTSSMETIESGITDVSSEASIMRMEWAGSGSSIGSGKHARSSVENLDSKSALQTSDNSLKSKGSGEISFYSKVKRSLNIRMRLNPDSKKLSGSSQSEGSDFLDLNSQHNGHLESDQGSQHSITDSSAALLKPTSPVSKHGKMADYTNKQKKKNETNVKANKPATDPSTPIKASFFNMKRTPSFLKKGRAKDYMVHIPTPPSRDLRLSSQRPRNASTNNIKTQSEHDKLPNLEPARLLGIHSDSSRVVELQRPKNGFLGLYLAKKSHDRHSGLFVVQMSSAFSSAFPQGILQVGDEVLEINRRRARDLSMVEINSLLEESSCVLLHVLPAGDRR